MNQHHYELCIFFLRFELEMRKQKRFNVAKFAEKQRLKYERKYWGNAS